MRRGQPRQGHPIGAARHVIEARLAAKVSLFPAQRIKGVGKFVRGHVGNPILNDLQAGLDTLNGTVYSAYGRGAETLATNRFGSTSSSNKMTELDNAMLAACAKVKAQGIELYVTSFGAGVSTATRTRLQTCATDADNYQHNTSSADLAAFFNHIGQDVLNKSIYVSK